MKTKKFLKLSSLNRSELQNVKGGKVILDKPLYGIQPVLYGIPPTPLYGITPEETM